MANAKSTEQVAHGITGSTRTRRHDSIDVHNTNKDLYHDQADWLLENEIAYVG